MKKFKLPVTWEVSGFLEVEAESLKEAIVYFENNSDNLPLPDDFDYVDGSYDLSCHEEEYVELYQ